MVAVDAESYFPGQGGAIVNRFGQLVGLQLTSTTGMAGPPSAAAAAVVGLAQQGNGCVLGVSEFFMRDGVAAILELTRRKQNSCCDNRLLKHLSSVADLQGTYYKYLKGFAGMSYSMVQSDDYNSYLADLADGRRNTVINADGSLFEGPPYKLIGGIRVETLAGSDIAAPAYVTIPGTATVAAPYNITPTLHTDSNYLNTVNPGDFVMTVNGECFLGNESEQIAPALLTWKLLDGDQLSLSLRQKDVDDAFAGDTGVAGPNHLDNLNSVTGNLLTYPPEYDYFWATINNFPYITAVGAATLVPPFPPTMLLGLNGLIAPDNVSTDFKPAF